MCNTHLRASSGARALNILSESSRRATGTTSATVSCSHGVALDICNSALCLSQNSKLKTVQPDAVHDARV